MVSNYLFDVQEFMKETLKPLIDKWEGEVILDTILVSSDEYYDMKLALSKAKEELKLVSDNTMSRSEKERIDKLIDEITRCIGESTITMCYLHAK